eukprot:Amastigsp_a1137_20.p9 type:complete len:101 gc:universal Amastigsp_a1137_20:1758-1456(-)
MSSDATTPSRPPPPLRRARRTSSRSAASVTTSLRSSNRARAPRATSSRGNDGCKVNAEHSLEPVLVRRGISESQDCRGLVLVSALVLCASKVLDHSHRSR